MDHVPIPDKLKRFILLGIPSVPYLEAILLLRADPNKSWDYTEISQRLYLGDAAGQALFAELKAGGILNSDADVPSLSRYRPQTQDLLQMIDLLAEVYPKNLVEITNLIHSKLNRKARQFADAFLLRKDK